MNEAEKRAFEWASMIADGWYAGYQVDERDLAAALAFLKAYAAIE